MRWSHPKFWSILTTLALIFGATAAVSTSPAVAGDSGDTGSLSGGDNFTCAVTSAGTVKCWGANPQGQLGDGTTTPQTTPQTVPGLNDVVEVSAGWQHACALTTVGGVKCWGLNTNDQTGTGSALLSVPIPTDVVGLGSGVAAISSGLFHTCALTDTGGVKCWGNNSSGELGDDSTTSQRTPVDVTGLASGVAGIAAGDGITCAVLDTGALKCWGNNTNGGVGDGTTTNRPTPTDVVGLGSGVASVSAAGTNPMGSRVCAVTTSGAAKCWGVNNQGQLGDGTTTHRSTPVDVVGLGSGVATITTGSSQTCALTTSGAAKCWGQWAVGVGNNDLHLTPLDVVDLDAGVTEVRAGGFHTCARKASGAVMCWGGNNSGQLGLGFVGGTHGLIPRDVSGSFHRPECPTVVPNPRTTITSSDGYGVGSVLTFAADPGFALDAPTSLTCGADLTFDGTAPLASSSSTITLDPAIDLRGGDVVDAAFTGFAPDTVIGWCQAVTDAPTSAGNCSSVFLGETDENGALTTMLEIDRFIYSPGHDRWADCTAEQCLIAAAAVTDLNDTVTSVPLDLTTDAPPIERGTITLDPTRQAHGNLVTINGTGFRPNRTVDIFQCTVDPATPSDCNRSDNAVTSDGAGNVTAELVAISTVEPPGGSATSCFDPSGACVFVAAEAQDFGGTAASAPLVDIGPVPTVVPGGGSVLEGDAGGVLVVEVTLTNDWHEPIEVPWSTIFESSWDPVLRADPGLDYTAVSGTVTFAPGETVQTVSIPLVDDNVAETGELVVVSFQRPTNASLGGFYGLGLAVIFDDDAEG